MFAQYSLIMHNLNSWHKSNFSHVQINLTNAKTFISLFDSLEEARNLTSLEFKLRTLLREHAFHLANIIESRWHQRARVQWLKCGDRNTRFFHATASAKLRKKCINLLEVDGQAITNPNEILHAFTVFYQKLLGSTSATYPCSIDTLYGDRPLLSELAAPFTQFEIKKAVCKLSGNKASGPDGLPNEFAKLKWDTIHVDLVEAFNNLHRGSLNLQELNLAHITLLPKQQNATSLIDYRLISIINYLPKLISKVLAIRLTHHIKDLVSSSQSGFIKGRKLQENFLGAREIVCHLVKCKQPAILLKLDFFKAFDTVNWHFLYSVLAAFGIPPKFIAWVRLLLSTATSSVLINGQVGPVFQHHQGLRQGDPLSPFLFILVADVLAKMCNAVATSVPFAISNRLASPFHILQFADDTLIFCTEKGKAVQALKLTLTIFSLCSGLNLNLAKSTFVPFNLSHNNITSVEQILLCEHSYLPLTYLGLPLTFTRPSRDLFQGLIEKIDKKLAGWKFKLLSRAGRLTLVTSVLSSIPTFYMSVFRLPSWVIKEIDKRRRSFLWGKSNNNGKGIPLLAWDRVCLPKVVGGLGVLNLRIMNTSLMLKWLWLLYTKPSAQWPTIAQLLISSRNSTAPIAWKTHGSFFWKDLLKLRHIFTIATATNIADGKKTLFWYANWGSGHLHYFSSSSKPPNPNITVFKVLSDRIAALPSPWQEQTQLAISNLHALQASMSTREADGLEWIWGSSGKFSVNSAYKMLILAGKTYSGALGIWSIKVPPTVKIFAVLLFYNKLLTQEVLLKRNIPFDVGCALCKQGLLETATHLFCQCSYAVELWSKVRMHFPSQLSVSHPDVHTFLTNALLVNTGSSSLLKATISITFLWAIWLERNNRTFRNEERGVDTLLHWLMEQHNLFSKFC
ncbi:hypothetical protein LUZ63_004200 [Rhynchospora breviuscula]|uniref:Reverse transcriptase domain-containing protein n=1 Tax=Rhynchospora breviuscula TaxID=2022672 RepID=A0A9Q0D222_9POAL|nr:hypothetical protein LUZ63_004200 [Rhynchospora breviuscula]